MEQFLDEADEDVLCIILSFLSPPEIASYAQVSTRIHSICRAADSSSKLWRPMCHRRWGSSTSLNLWNPRQTLHYKSLYKILSKWEPLIGFWRGVGNRSQLLAFEWGSSSIQGFRIIGASRGSFHVKRVPYLWIGAASNGDEICVLNPGTTPSGSDDCDRCHLSSEPEPACSTSNELFSKINADWDVQELTELGLLLVNVEFVGKNHFVLEELRCGKQIGRKKISLAEAVASASFGFSEDGWSSDIEKYGESPPGSFPYEMYQFLTSKVSPGSDRAARKQRRKEKERAEIQGGRRRILEQQHFVKVVNFSPTKARPLQGLWKGICQCSGLDFVLVSYNEQGVVICKQIGETGRRARSWLIESPCTSLEDEGSGGAQVAGVFEFDKSEEELSGRIWIYKNGGFGFTQLHSNHVVDFRSICSDNALLDVVC